MQAMAPYAVKGASIGYIFHREGSAYAFGLRSRRRSGGIVCTRLRLDQATMGATLARARTGADSFFVSSAKARPALAQASG